MVSLNTSSRSPSQSDCLIELIPRSESARLIDFVKFKGTVEGSLRSSVRLTKHILLEYRSAEQSEISPKIIGNNDHQG